MAAATVKAGFGTSLTRGAGVVTAITLGYGGLAYTQSDALTLASRGGATQAATTAATVSGTGVVLTLGAINPAGAGYAVEGLVPVTGGTGTGCLVNVATITEVFTALTESTGYGGPSQARDSIDASHNESPNQFKEFLAGWADAGEIKVDGHYLPDAETKLLLDLQYGVTRNYKLVVPAATSYTWTLRGFVTRFEPSYPMDGKMVCTATIKLTGKPTIAAT